MKYFFYILKSEILGKFYLGHTNNTSERLKKHLCNHKGYTSRAKDWKLVYTEEYPDKASACKREYEVKKWKSRSRIEKLIESKESSRPGS